MEATERPPQRAQSYFGVSSSWAFAALVPAAVATLATQTLFWGLVGILAALVAAPLFAGARGTMTRAERLDWFGVPALAVWLGAAASIAGGWPTDAALFSSGPAGLAVVVLAMDALVRGKIG